MGGMRVMSTGEERYFVGRHDGGVFSSEVETAVHMGRAIERHGYDS